MTKDVWTNLYGLPKDVSDAAGAYKDAIDAAYSHIWDAVDDLKRAVFHYAADGQRTDDMPWVEDIRKLSSAVSDLIDVAHDVRDISDEFEGVVE